MKKIAILFAFTFTLFCNAQVRENIAIQWNEKQMYPIGDYSIKIPQFSASNLVYDSSKKVYSTLLECKPLL